jgi:hypothetical protein
MNLPESVIFKYLFSGSVTEFSNSNVKSFLTLLEFNILKVNIGIKISIIIKFNFFLKFLFTKKNIMYNTHK